MRHQDSAVPSRIVPTRHSPPMRAMYPRHDGIGLRQHYSPLVTKATSMVATSGYLSRPDFLLCTVAGSLKCHPAGETSKNFVRGVPAASLCASQCRDDPICIPRVVVCSLLRLLCFRHLLPRRPGSIKRAKWKAHAQRHAVGILGGQQPTRLREIGQ